MILMFVQLFKNATAFFSFATPYLAKVIPAMNHIDQHLTTAACNNAYKPCIQAAITMGKKLLNKYYSYTYHSELYWIAMGGFPSLIEYWFNVIFQYITLPPVSTWNTCKLQVITNISSVFHIFSQYLTYTLLVNFIFIRYFFLISF